jgi:hypothetical protein
MERYCSTGQSPQQAVVPMEKRREACSEFFIIGNLKGPGELKQWKYCCENRNS